MNGIVMNDMRLAWCKVARVFPFNFEPAHETRPLRMADELLDASTARFIDKSKIDEPADRAVRSWYVTHDIYLTGQLVLQLYPEYRTSYLNTTM